MADNPEQYAKLANEGLLLGYPIKIGGIQSRPDNGIHYHSTIKYFDKAKDHPHTIHELAQHLPLNPPDAKNTQIKFDTFKDRLGNDVYAITLHGNSADKLKEQNGKFEHMGFPSTFEWTPHISVDKNTFDRIKNSGAKTAHEAGIQFGPAVLKRGPQILKTYHHEPDTTEPKVPDESDFTAKVNVPKTGPLEKSQPNYEFPGLPKVRSRAETNVQPISSPRQKEIFERKVAQSLGANLDNVGARTRKLLSPTPDKLGVAHIPKTLANGEMDQRTPIAGAIPGIDPTIFEHEGFHNTMRSVDQKYGDGTSAKIVNRMLGNFDKKSLSALSKYIREKGGYDKKSPHFNEELLNYARDISENPAHREAFKAMHGDKAGQHLNNLKAGVKKAAQHAKHLKESHLKEPQMVPMAASEDLSNMKPLMKPYVSEAQRRWAHTQSGKEALGGNAGVHEWDEATKGKKLPERVGKSLEKGSLQNRTKFNPKGALSEPHQESMAAWQGAPNAERAGNREKLPKMEGNSRERALHKLSGQTKTKLIGGKRHFLLHRGMSPEEYSSSVNSGTANHSSQHSSWTPRQNLANNFANPYSKAPGKMVSAWVHEDNIHTVPKQFGAVDKDYSAASGNRSNRMANEHEVIVKPNHSSKVESESVAEKPTSRKGDRIHDAPANINDAINIKGAKEQKARSMNAHPDDIRNMIGQSNRDVMADQMKNKKFGKSELPLEKGAIKNAGLALGMMGALAGSPQQANPVTPPSAKIESATRAPAYDHGKMLRAFAQVESNNGQNINHASTPGGTAYGKYGLMPNTIKDTIKAHKDLNAQHGKALALNGDQLTRYMQDHKGLEDTIADRNLSHMEHVLGPNVEHLGYGWLNGISGALKAKKQGFDFNNHWHVKKVKDAYDKEK